MKRAFALTAALVLLGLSIAAQAAITIATIPVGNRENAGELSGSGVAGGFGPDRICGSVGYNYNIGKYEVTAGQYTAFLNAKAKVSDPYGLYNASMWDSSFGCKIQRGGGGTVSNPYTYTVASDRANRPVNYVSYWDACRFANWLGNGQGAAGDTETGAYTLGGYNRQDGRTIGRNANWKWAVTSEDEWYKAAFYKGGSTSAGYWDYPTSSDMAPGRDMADASGNNANIYMGSGAYPIDSGKYITVAGEFQNSDSPYGTFDQGGNVWEWTGTVDVQDLNYAPRNARGGGFGHGSAYLKASNRNRNYYPNYDGDGVGFRLSQVVPVPEPSSIMALAGGLVSLLGIRRRRA